MGAKRFWVYVLLLGAIFFIGCDKEMKTQSTISVLGTGTVLVQPDMIQMSITLSNVAETTKEAQEEVSRMVRQSLAILKEASIEDRNISTASLTFRSEYEYTTRRILIGQRAEQVIAFSIEDIGNNDEKVSLIIDRLIQINGIELNQVNFSVKNNTEHFARSRELAFQKAVEKANQYAELANLKIVKVLSITDESSPQFSPAPRLSNVMYDAAEAAGSSSTALPSGELEITTRISVVFLLE
jgi:uncharacterized protein YggE